MQWQRNLAKQFTQGTSVQPERKEQRIKERAQEIIAINKAELAEQASHY